jgi:hypothetical protein
MRRREFIAGLGSAAWPLAASRAAARTPAALGVLNRESPARHSFTSPVYVRAGFCSPFPLV